MLNYQRAIWGGVITVNFLFNPLIKWFGFVGISVALELKPTSPVSLLVSSGNLREPSLAIENSSFVEDSPLFFLVKYRGFPVPVSVTRGYIYIYVAFQHEMQNNRNAVEMGGGWDHCS